MVSYDVRELLCVRDPSAPDASGPQGRMDGTGTATRDAGEGRSGDLADRRGEMHCRCFLLKKLLNSVMEKKGY